MATYRILVGQTILVTGNAVITQTVGRARSTAVIPQWTIPDVDSRNYIAARPLSDPTATPSYPFRADAVLITGLQATPPVLFANISVTIPGIPDEAAVSVAVLAVPSQVRVVIDGVTRIDYGKLSGYLRLNIGQHVVGEVVSFLSQINDTGAARGLMATPTAMATWTIPAAEDQNKIAIRPVGAGLDENPAYPFEANAVIISGLAEGGSLPIGPDLWAVIAITVRNAGFQIEKTLKVTSTPAHTEINIQGP